MKTDATAVTGERIAARVRKVRMPGDKNHEMAQSEKAAIPFHKNETGIATPPMVFRYYPETGRFWVDVLDGVAVPLSDALDAVEFFTNLTREAIRQGRD